MDPLCRQILLSCHHQAHCEFALLDLGPCQRLCPDTVSVFTRPLAGKPPSVVPLIYLCCGGGWWTSKSSSDVSAPAAGVDGAGIDIERLHQQASSGHRRLSLQSCEEDVSTVPPDETHGGLRLLLPGDAKSAKVGVDYCFFLK